MGIELTKLLTELNALLRPQDFRDYCPNGLQVEGKKNIGKLITGVTASQALIEAAIAEQADAIFVHHGYFWRGEKEAIAGIKKQRIKRLLEHDISLFAYHLPLDAHAELGNNVQLGNRLGFSVAHELDPKFKSHVGVCGELTEPVSADKLLARIQSVLGREPFHVPGNADTIKTVAWCTGSAQNYIEKAHEWGVDAYLTGEVSEQTVHFARETGIHFIAAGHHATERYGVQAVGEYLAEKYALQHLFIDIDNPV